MKDCLLLVALLATGSCLVNNYFWRIMLIIVNCFLVFHYLNSKERIFGWSILIVLAILSLPLYGYINEGRVKTIRDNYLIVGKGIKNVLVYTDCSVNLDDYIRIDEYIEPIISYQNFETSSFESWAKGQNIIGSCRIKEVEVIRESHSLRSFIYRHNQKYHNDAFNQLLFGTGLDIDGQYRFLFVASGLHYGFLALLIKKLAGYFFYPEKSHDISCILMILMLVIFGESYGLIRTIVNLITEKFIDDKRNRLAVSILVMVFYRPYYVLSTSFLIPFGIRIINVFSTHKSNITASIYIMSVQLMLYGYCDIIAVLGFGIQRIIAGYLFGISLIGSLLPVTFKLAGLINGLLLGLEKVAGLEINGSLPLLLFLMVFYLLTVYGDNGKRKYLIYIFIVLVLNCNNQLFKSFYTVTFLDVGQGDSCVISLPFSKKAVLIDTGGNVYKDIGADILVPYLKREGFNKAEVIISHDDYDHSGALESLANLFKVDKIYRKKQEVIQINGLNIYNPLADYEFADNNDNSLISYFKLSKFGFLFMGDCSKAVDEVLVDKYNLLDVSVCKISHHGSSTGTSDNFCAVYDFPYAIISAGRNNRYGHPDKEVVERLENYGVKILNTQSEHAIRFIVLNHLLIYQTNTNKLGLYWR